MKFLQTAIHCLLAGSLLIAGPALAWQASPDSTPASGAASPAGTDATAPLATETAAAGAEAPAATTFTDDCRRLLDWFVTNWVPFLASVALLYVVACLASWGLGAASSVRPLAAPRWGTLIAFLLWLATGLFLWPWLGWSNGFLPAFGLLAVLHWGLWLLLAIVVIGIAVGLLSAAVRRARV